MPWRRKDACIQCGTPASEAGISARGLCMKCGAENMRTNAEQLRDKAGPAYNYYRKRRNQAMIRALLADGETLPPHAQQ